MCAGALGGAADCEPAEAGEVFGAGPGVGDRGVAASVPPPSHRRQFTSVTPPPPGPKPDRPPNRTARSAGIVLRLGAGREPPGYGAVQWRAGCERNSSIGMP